MYGGAGKRNDEVAMKAASHELKGVVNIYHKARELELPISLPLLTLVDYRGYRLLASRYASARLHQYGLTMFMLFSILPIGKDTLVLGSSDAGASFHKKDEKIFDAVCKIGTAMKLREHGAVLLCLRPSDLIACSKRCARMGS